VKLYFIHQYTFRASSCVQYDSPKETKMKRLNLARQGTVPFSRHDFSVNHQVVGTSRTHLARIWQESTIFWLPAINRKVEICDDPVKMFVESSGVSYLHREAF
jgi:hypothetical protein